MDMEASKSADSVRKKSRLSLNKHLIEPHIITKNNFNVHTAQLVRKSYRTSGNESDDSLIDFKSPKKVVEPKRKLTKLEQERAWAMRPPPPPHGFKNTQEMIVTLWKKTKSKEKEYLSEDEFEIFRKMKKPSEQIKQTNSDKAKLTESCQKLSTNNERVSDKTKRFQEAASQTIAPILKETLNVGTQCPELNNAFDDPSLVFSVEDKKDLKLNLSVVPKVPTFTKNCANFAIDKSPSNSASNKPLSNNRALRKELQTMQVRSVVIPDSDEEIIPSSQITAPKQYKMKMMNACEKNDESIASPLFESLKHESSLLPETKYSRNTMNFSGTNIDSLQKQMRILKRKVGRLPSLQGYTRLSNLSTCYSKRLMKYAYLRKFWWINRLLKRRYILQSRLDLQGCHHYQRRLRAYNYAQYATNLSQLFQSWLWLFVCFVNFSRFFA